MSDSTHALLLLDLIAVERPIDVDRYATLDESAWDDLTRMARQHRLEPLLGQRLVQDPDCFPDPVAARLVERRRAQAVAGLRAAAELERLRALFSEVGIVFAALKGAYLGRAAYPRPELRPLRDIDILVPRNSAVEAWRLLEAKGYGQIELSQGSPESALDFLHQMPPARSPATGMAVEVHFRLFHDRERGDGYEPSEDPAFWERLVRLGEPGRAIAYPSPTDTLLHLIEHAAYGHGFDNGPLLLSDIAWLVRSGAIDWTLFWSLADRAHCRHGALLSFALTRRYWPSVVVPEPESGPGSSSVPSALIDATALIMLQDASQRKDLKLSLQTRLRRRSGNLSSFVLGRLFPSRLEMANMYPVDPRSPRMPLFYARRLWEIGTRRRPTLIGRSRTRKEQSSSHADLAIVDHMLAVHDWLERHDGAVAAH
ncbi:MAG: nucleotidyltransferase family protein [Rhizorhabdus sp.]|uniref:nucleotidyltransferase domain-containing protein n=1 Tax=Rhizorhabdus sp. TaxID=1968843 RepID=UPI001B3E0CD4|nr:nucleotidyltransferase family protein [Rhizorhabdus sp.]MBP8233922.1 nucleotidyltransferase family protein [Rhizorhabdus sp.]